MVKIFLSIISGRIQSLKQPKLDPNINNQVRTIFVEVYNIVCCIYFITKPILSFVICSRLKKDSSANYYYSPTVANLIVENVQMKFESFQMMALYGYGCIGIIHLFCCSELQKS